MIIINYTSGGIPYSDFDALDMPEQYMERGEDAIINTSSHMVQDAFVLYAVVNDVPEGVFQFQFDGYPLEYDREIGLINVPTDMCLTAIVSEKILDAGYKYMKERQLKERTMNRN